MHQTRQDLNSASDLSDQLACAGEDTVNAFLLAGLASFFGRHHFHIQSHTSQSSVPAMFCRIGRTRVF